MSEEHIQIKIPNAREKLKVSFPQDPRGDLRLVFKSKSFKLQKAYLRLESNFFKKKCLPNLQLLQVREDFNIGNKVAEEEFQMVMSCFYGNRISVPRNQVLNYYPIIKFLEVDSLLTQLRKDMVDNVEFYDLFVLIKLAHKYSEQQIFQTCLMQLEKQSFQQIKYSPSEFLSCEIQLFKLIIKTHNRKKSLDFPGLDYKYIDDLIRHYCESNNLLEEKYHEFKFQLIDKTKLTANEYKQIFMDELATNRMANPRMSMIRTDPMMFLSASDPAIGKGNQLYESCIQPSDRNILSNDLTVQMQNIYQKKLNEQLQLQKSHLASSLKKLEESTNTNHSCNLRLQGELSELRDKVKGKDRQQRDQKTMMARFEKIIDRMTAEMKEKDKTIGRLEDKVQKLSELVSTHDLADTDNDQLFAESTIIPANVLGDIMREKTHQKKQPEISASVRSEKLRKESEQCREILESMDDEDLEEKYSSRISFDKDPVSVPKIYIPKLVDFLGTDGFSKKNCRLIYRRSEKCEKFGEIEDIYGHSQLILTIKTCTGECIGGFISRRIPKNCQGEYLQDGQAFIFNLTKGRKFNIKKSAKSEAIMSSNPYLICFGNDLMISRDCLNQKNYCEWSDSYEKGTADEKGPKWFAGGTEFMIKDLEFYEIEEEEMEMVL